MAESAPKEGGSSPEPVVISVTERWVKVATHIKRFRGPIVAVATFGAILSGLLGYWTAYQTVEKIVAPNSSQIKSDPAVLSVAVMPFEPATSNPDDVRFAERMTQDVTSSVERGSRFARVVSHGLVVKYRDKSNDARAVGRELNVRYVVEGEVRANEGSRFVITRLVDTATGITVSSTRAGEHSSASDGDAVLVAQLSNHIRATIYGAEQKRVANMPTSGATAVELALHADQITEINPSPTGIRKARKLYEEALHRDPNSIPALVGLYLLKETETIERGGPASDQVIRELDELSRRAVSIDRSDPRVWYIRSDALMWQQQWDRALEANAAGLEIDPYSSTIVRDRGFLLQVTGRPREALSLLDRAIALDPRGSGVENALQLKCAAHLNLGEYDQAIAACERSLALADGWLKYLFLLGASEQKGNAVKATAAKAELLKRKPEVTIASLKNGPQFWANPDYQQQRETHLYVGLRKAGIPER